MAEVLDPNCGGIAERILVDMMDNFYALF